MLGLENELPQRARLSFWPFIDICAIGLLFALFGSKFVMAPGLTLNLPQVGSTHVAIAEIYEVITVSEVNGEEMIFFQDSVLTLQSFERLLDERERPDEQTTLLVRADYRVSMQTLSSLNDLAIKSGYRKVQLATEEQRVDPGPYFIRE